jgi:transcription initiation factor TFIID subunit 6
MASGGSVWNPENIRDVAESVGIGNLSNEVVDHLTRDVEFRIAQVLEEALKFMRHSRRTTLFTQDISQALRVLDVEPLYGYETTRPLKFGEASIGPGQPLFYLEDEEVDFEKLINAPLPRVPREITFTAHWLAVEGVQPTIPQNPTPADSSRNTDILSKGQGTSTTVGSDSLSVKPLVKHILSKELQLYFEHVCAALLDEHSEQYRVAALGSLSADPGLHQLIPYFVQYVAEKVTHNLKNVFVLFQMLHLVSALLQNPNLHIVPYVASLVPPVLTCLIGKRLGSSAPTDSTSLPAHYALRDLAGSVMQQLTRPDFTAATPTMKPRLARTLLKTLLSETTLPLGAYYGSILGLNMIAGSEGVHVLILPNLHALDDELKDALVDESKKLEVDAVVEVVIRGLETLEGDALFLGKAAGDDGMDAEASEGEKTKILERLGSVVGEKVLGLGRRRLLMAVCEAQIEI